MGQVCAVASQSSQTLETHGRTVHHTVMLLDSNNLCNAALYRGVLPT